ncbi:MAG: dihydrolipoyl dehydrogenase [Bacteroidetes bacterium]|jgi:dihydrolipoamide dehydrogenase|nr:dihydrolipoyl dehydrogenase [Bacteroidota bacterium]MBT3749495.1 dihydrolipoyl dehydrogenase [Bacteroidota bacterium]MBT4400234.1 dihydrolipoyl dehydrogenase [Bacteroidota bacterium]MBT4409254.1 dihydrolipoyl dehydrogenase [Bacteroidota bacterium]MBT5426741.1 dihydrolipoyl dehydrogenase [Bacteroidota bacterium]
MDYDLIIIGAGPAGYVAAIRAGQLGMKTALVEKNAIGGMCLNWGCIPTKALIESAKLYDRIKNADRMGIDGINLEELHFNWKNAKNRASKVVRKLTGGIAYLLKKNGVDVIQGEAIITGSSTISVENRTLECKNILIATGSYPASIDLNIPRNKLTQVENMLDMNTIPDKIILYGHGPVTVELAQFFRMIDHEVTLVSPQTDILPGIDKYLTEFILKKVKAQGIKIIADEKISVSDEGEMLINNSDVLAFDTLINCSWRGAVVPANEVELALDDKGFIAVNEHLETSVKGIYAIGDVNGLSYLAHAASAQGIFTVNHLHGVKGEMELNNYPVNVYTVPELSQIGLTEEQVRAQGIDYRIGEFPMTANGKALAEDTSEGFIRILSEKKMGEVLGVQIVAANATDLIAEAAAFMSVEATVYDVARTVHAHPTISEVFLEAGMDAADKSIHK